MLALIAGRGGLPARIAAAQSTPPLICALQGFEPDGLVSDEVFRLEQLGSLLVDLKERGVSEVCMCGAIERPPIDPSALDDATLPLVPIIMKALSSGDDGALRAVIAVLEAQGFVVRAAQDLAPDIIVRAGVLSAAEPDDQMLADAAKAEAVLTALSPLDVGQGCVVGKGQVWAIETLGGTDHMLDTLPASCAKARAILLKKPKLGQDRRVDMPTIGPATVIAAARAGLAGILVEAGSVILLEPEATRTAADAAGLVLWARAAS
ncbi:MAG: UDP-2,3-diacylglucosamine diphosphatase LpxI [Paracoccaceae bacterium]|nr:UDP-2,3-diacylglucosamine diphosphatase LpxI [Paracoccaceae bacterium]